MENSKVRYRGRLSQISIYLGKLLRMFVYQNDWKMLLMAALIAGLVTIAVGANLFKTQEGTMAGCFALVCVCVWNGVFNSIQVICRERGIVKREHRSGMHITSYIGAHMIYQMLICALQTVILLVICRAAGVAFPKEGLVTGWFMIDFGISMFLITYAADMMGLMVSAMVKTTTTAMTVMPFLLIFELVFSGSLLPLEGIIANVKGLTLVKWGQQAFSALGKYNELPMVTLWNTVWKFRSMEFDGIRPVELFTDYVLENDMRDQLLLESGKYNASDLYVSTASNVLHCWGALLLFIVVFAAVAVIVLKFIDKDKR